MSEKATVLIKAEFNPRIKKYLLISGVVISAASIVGIIIIPFWLLIGPHFIRKYYRRLRCELTTRSLKFEKGIIFHTERTIPLDKIQDLTFKEGPLLRYFGLSILKVETAGSSGESSSDLTLIGITDASDFRQQVLDQRDKVTDRQSSEIFDNVSTLEVLKEIHQSLKNIERYHQQSS